jgi:hypothetical protein
MFGSSQQPKPQFIPDTKETLLLVERELVRLHELIEVNAFKNAHLEEWILGRIDRLQECIVYLSIGVYISPEGKPYDLKSK